MLKQVQHDNLGDSPYYDTAYTGGGNYFLAQLGLNKHSRCQVGRWSSEGVYKNDAFIR